MSPSAECPINRRLLYVGILSALLIALAHVVAMQTAWYVGRSGSPAVHTATYYHVIFSIWATAILLTPALCFYILFRPGPVEEYWRALWTFAYVAFLFHLYWTVLKTFQLNFYEIFHSHSGFVANREHTVDQPAADLFLAFWWGLDVVLLWAVRWEIRWIRLQRGLLHLVAFVMFVMAFTAPKASRGAHMLGMVMAGTVLSAYMTRLLFRQPDPKSFGVFVYVTLFRIINRIRVAMSHGLVWHRMPLLFAIGNLDGLREVLRAKNLHNTSDIPASNPTGLRRPVAYRPAYLHAREPDGWYNDLTKPAMGSASLNEANPADTSDFTLSSPGARFGRNIPLSEVDPERDGGLLDPNPRDISNVLLSRSHGGFKPAETMNLLAAAWIQFQVHDWFNHGAPVETDPIIVPPGSKDDRPGCPMLIRRTRPDPTRRKDDGNGPVTYVNAESHWWDGSQIYGSSHEAEEDLRERRGGRLALDAHGLLPMEKNGLERTGLSANWWIGLSLMHNLFAREHNAICDHLAREFPDWEDAQLYRTARLVNVALMAKIHTLEWTPCLLGHPVLQVGMKGNWWGFATERIKKVLRRISEGELVSGIPGSETNHHGADYCLTEEFVSVYRMHALMPDRVAMYRVADGSDLQRMITLDPEMDREAVDVVSPGARDRALADSVRMEDLFYSLGRANPGALVLHNYPDWMRRLQRRKSDGTPDEVIDLAAIDIVRDRERGVPRYNRFRKLFHLKPVKTFEELVAEPEWAEDLRKIYEDVDQVDLMVGLYAEKKPEGFGISDTAFRVFLLMASRRLKSDRFFTIDYTPKVYTQRGIDWVENNTMRTVLLRHYPVLAAALYGVPNAFSPWNDVRIPPEKAGA